MLVLHTGLSLRQAQEKQTRLSMQSHLLSSGFAPSQQQVFHGLPHRSHILKRTTYLPLQESFLQVRTVLLLYNVLHWQVSDGEYSNLALNLYKNWLPLYNSQTLYYNAHGDF